VLFTADLEGSTELASALTPEAGDGVRHEHFSALRQAIATSRGHRGEQPGRRLMVVSWATHVGCGLNRPILPPTVRRAATADRRDP
jgi:class 3 adenylate cyclase